MYFGSYCKDGIDKDRKIIIWIIKKILKLLIDRKSRAKISTTFESTTQAFKAFKKKAKKSKKRRSFSKSDRKNCIYYLKGNHNSFSY